MQILKARYHTRDEFNQAWDPSLDVGGLFIPTTSPLRPGEPIVVELVCDGLPNKVLIRGTVKSWRPALPRLRVRAGAVVEFAEDERAKCEFVQKTLAGDATATRRKHTRIPIAIDVAWRLANTVETRTARVSEISVGGALMHTDEAPEIGTELVLALTPPGGAAPLEILSKVSYKTPSGGVGLKFTFRDGGGARRLREIIRRLRAA